MGWSAEVGLTETAGGRFVDRGWDLAMLALRAGANPQALITTAPRPAVAEAHPRRGDHRPDDRDHLERLNLPPT